MVSDAWNQESIHRPGHQVPARFRLLHRRTAQDKNFTSDLSVSSLSAAEQERAHPALARHRLRLRAPSAFKISHRVRSRFRQAQTKRLLLALRTSTSSIAAKRPELPTSPPKLHAYSACTQRSSPDRPTSRNSSTCTSNVPHPLFLTITAISEVTVLATRPAWRQCRIASSTRLTSSLLTTSVTSTTFGLHQETRKLPWLSVRPSVRPSFHPLRVEPRNCHRHRKSQNREQHLFIIDQLYIASSGSNNGKKLRMPRAH